MGFLDGLLGGLKPKTYSNDPTVNTIKKTVSTVSQVTSLGTQIYKDIKSKKPATSTIQNILTNPSYINYPGFEVIRNVYLDYGDAITSVIDYNDKKLEPRVKPDSHYGSRKLRLAENNLDRSLQLAEEVVLIANKYQVDANRAMNKINYPNQVSPSKNNNVAVGPLEDSMGNIIPDRVHDIEAIAKAIKIYQEYQIKVRKETIQASYGIKEEDKDTITLADFTDIPVNSTKGSGSKFETTFRGRKDINGLTIGSDHLWDISIKPWDHTKAGISGKSYVPEMPKLNNYANGFIPIISYDFDDYRPTTEKIDIYNGETLNIITGITKDYKVSIDILEDDYSTWRKYFDSYFRLVYNSEQNTVAPYKQSCFQLDLYIFNTRQQAHFRKSVLVVPIDYPQQFSGDSDPSEVIVKVDFTVVGDLNWDKWGNLGS